MAPQAAPVLSTDDPHSGFRSHYEHTARAIIDYLDGLHFWMTGKDVADIGCGDGALDLGLAHRAKPRLLVGYDLDGTNDDIGSDLKRLAAHAGLTTELPACLDFARSDARSIPVRDESFDFVVTRSVFTRAAQPVAIAREIRRIMRPSGVLFLLHELHPFDYTTLDELQRILLASGLLVRVVEIDTPTVDLPAETGRYRLADVGISGIKLVAAPC